MAEQTFAAYYLQREQKERELASAATDAQIATIHIDMAERYARLAEEEAERALTRTR